MGSPRPGGVGGCVVLCLFVFVCVWFLGWFWFVFVFYFFVLLLNVGCGTFVVEGLLLNVCCSPFDDCFWLFCFVNVSSFRVTCPVCWFGLTVHVPAACDWDDVVEGECVLVVWW